MNAAVMAVKNEPGWEHFADRVAQHVDVVIVADESDGPCFGGGIGPSLVWAWDQALKQGADRIVQIDPGSHNPFSISRFLNRDTDICVGSRFLPTSEYKGRRWRSHASRAYSRFQNHRSGQHLTDWTSGYRSFSADCLATLVHCHFTAKMHGWQAEVLHRALTLGFTVEEIPIRYVAGDSSMNWKHALEAVKVT